MPVWSEEQLHTHPIIADTLQPPCPPRAAASARPWRAQVGDAEPPGVPGQGDPNRTNPPHLSSCALVTLR